jgi:hypothetical protein
MQNPGSDAGVFVWDTTRSYRLSFRDAPLGAGPESILTMGPWIL